MTLTEPQVWAALGILATALFGSVTLLTAQVNRTITAQIGGFRAELVGQIAELRSELKGDIQVLRTEITHLDHDVQTLAHRVFKNESGD